MPFQIVRSQLDHRTVDVVVKPVVSSEKNTFFGPRVGTVTVSSAGAPNRYEFRVVCPSEKSGGDHSERKLKQSYERCLKLAKRKGAASIAIPLLPGFESGNASQIAMDAARAFLEKQELQIYLVVLDREAFQMPQLLRQELSDYIERNYIQQMRWSSLSFGAGESKFATAAPCPMETAPCPMPAAPYKQAGQVSLEEWLRRTDAGFSDTLLMLIDKTGKKDSEIYSKANVSRQHFSKIRNNPDYKPTKSTAIAFAIALELDMEQTLDLIGRAGYTLTTSSTFDLVIMYFIENRNYDLFDINGALFELDQSLLGV